MISFMTSQDFAARPALAQSMFEDRARQFRDRLGWPVLVDRKGQEKDQYDPLNPIYIVCERDGVHQASMRAMPTMGRTMAADYFAQACGRTIRHPLIWECTRFTLGQTADRCSASRVMLGGQIFGLMMGLQAAVGIYDLAMERVYRRLGWEPNRLGIQSGDDGPICAGLWDFSIALKERLERRARLSSADVEQSFRSKFGDQRNTLPAKIDIAA